MEDIAGREIQRITDAVRRGVTIADWKTAYDLAVSMSALRIDPDKDSRFVDMVRLMDSRVDPLTESDVKARINALSSPDGPIDAAATFDSEHQFDQLIRRLEQEAFSLDAYMRFTSNDVPMNLKIFMHLLLQRRKIDEYRNSWRLPKNVSGAAAPSPPPSPREVVPKLSKPKRKKSPSSASLDPALEVVYSEVPNFKMIPFAQITKGGMLAGTVNAKGVVRVIEGWANASTVEAAAAEISIALEGPEVFFVRHSPDMAEKNGVMVLEIGRTYNRSKDHTQVGTVCVFGDVAEYRSGEIDLVSYRLDQILRAAILLAHHCVVIAPFGLDGRDKLDAAEVAKAWVEILKKYQEFMPCVAIFRPDGGSEAVVSKRNAFFKALAASGLVSG